MDHLDQLDHVENLDRQAQPDLRVHVDHLEKTLEGNVGKQDHKVHLGRQDPLDQQVKKEYLKIKSKIPGARVWKLQTIWSDLKVAFNQLLF